MSDEQGGVDAPNRLVAGRYRLVRRLRTGEVGTVWEATDERLGRPVALTTLFHQQGSTEDHGVLVGRALRAARAAERLEHPNALTVYDVIQHDGEPCLVTELDSSPTLAGRLGSLGEHDTATLGAQVASALAAAHAAGIVHGDVTPADVLVTDDGTARLGGFGIPSAGIPAYRAPEVTSGAEPTSASDVFSLGATLYASLEGTPPSTPVEPPQHAPALAPLLLRMLATDPNARPTMAEVADRLSRLAAGEGDAEAPVAPPAPLTSSPPRRRRVIAVVAALVVAALVVAGVVLVRARDGNGPSSASPSQPTSTTTTSSAASTSAGPATSAPVSSSPATSTAATSSGPPTASQLADVVTRYYSLLPGNLDQAFGLLTADYQTRVAGGRQAYQRFWAQYSAVAATDVTGSPPSTVTATVAYTTTSGQIVRERTTFGLVDDGGVLKIGSATVSGRS